jgi:hypothetical protein
VTSNQTQYSEDIAMSECVDIVGVGLMGQAFSHHLLQAGFKVQGF